MTDESGFKCEECGSTQARVERSYRQVRIRQRQAVSADGTVAATRTYRTIEDVTEEGELEEENRVEWTGSEIDADDPTVEEEILDKELWKTGIGFSPEASEEIEVVEGSEKWHTVCIQCRHKEETTAPTQ